MEAIINSITTPPQNIGLADVPDGSKVRIILTPNANFGKASGYLKQMGGTFHPGIKIWTVVRDRKSLAQNGLNAPGMYGMRILATREYNHLARLFNDMPPDDRPSFRPWQSLQKYLTAYDATARAEE